MLSLGENYGKKLVSLAEVSKEHKISPYFLKHLASALKKKDLIISREGVRGGYSLSREPNLVSMGEIIEALSGKIINLPCSRKRNICKMKGSCKSGSFWHGFESQLQSSLSKISLADFINDNSIST
ncbi:MAG: RRF2 protein family [Candidatus Gottesmanbacteria bacterium GW2011_GWC2_39_8]|uniref:RRF2 protein family n=1 Tax=Candidatus Gottesmanbacteria bacterium GW2011_GWC2_39_8 TaxID=1618450 RepID=A0A0G0SER0_9BACT|nr:MAG: RRF2 protein family [Candidatus Gottesmanbacteria bacterium GW2011_GWC2_39_8]